MSGTYGLGGILRSSPDRALIDSAYRHDCEDGKALLPALAKANKAHALALARAGIVSGADLSELLDALSELEGWPVERFRVEPESGDVYNSFDENLKSLVGDSAGWLHAGRPRREAVNVAFGLTLRNGLVPLIVNGIELLRVFARVAERDIDVLMTDFTYFYHAQPTRFSHYILTFAHTLVRDLERLFDSMLQVNSSVGESGSVNGSRLRTDRRYFSELLGFDGVVTHCRDAMWQPDLPLDCISACASLMMNFARFAEELQIWSTAEFSLIRLPDRYCRASVIMPQKRNPYPLTYIRGLANLVIGRVSTYGSYGRVPSGNPDSRTFVYGDLCETVNKVSAATYLFSRVIDEMVVEKDRMRRSLDASDCFATELADELITRTGLNYGAVHTIVGRCVAQMEERGLPLAELGTDDIRAAADAAGYSIPHVGGLDLNTVFDAEKAVETRDVPGGAARGRVVEMIEDLRVTADLFEDKIGGMRERMRSADQFLENEIANVNA